MIPIKEDPYLSIVVTARNDGHGGDLLKRAALFFLSIDELSYKYKLPVEVIVVEWNPPLDKPFLHEVFTFNELNTYLSVRFIEVPGEIHNKMKNHDSLGLHQMIAKNVGIRRANADFVLCTNIDILFSEEVFQFFSEKKLMKNTFYRTLRCDVPNEIVNKKNLNEILNYAAKNILMKIGFKKHFKYAFPYPDFFFWFKNSLYILDRVLWVLRLLFTFNTKPQISFGGLDLWACGDFTLMSKDDWEKIKGYCEFEIYPLHVDSLAIISAWASGMVQYKLNNKACVYHIDHDGTWLKTSHIPENDLIFMAKKPSLEWYKIVESAKKLKKLKRPFEINSENWGLYDCHLKEVIKK